MKFVALLVIWMVVGLLAQVVVGILASVRTIRIERENDIEFDRAIKVLGEVKDEDSEVLSFNPFREKIDKGLLWLLVGNLFGYFTWPIYAVLMYRDYMKAINQHAIRKINEKLAAERLGS